LPCYLELVPGVLIISRDWQLRALLRAQLIEDGVDVRASTSPKEAAALVARRPFEGPGPEAEGQERWFSPALVLADLSVTPGRAEAEELATLPGKLLPGVPLWIVASRGEGGNESIERLRGPGLEEVLFRPIDLGALVKAIKLRLAVNS
jgi:CheY-like chemotaxis protein